MRLLAFPYTERPEHVIKKTVNDILLIHEYITNFVYFSVSDLERP